MKGSLHCIVALLVRLASTTYTTLPSTGCTGVDVNVITNHTNVTLIQCQSHCTSTSDTCFGVTFEALTGGGTLCHIRGDHCGAFTGTCSTSNCFYRREGCVTPRGKHYCTGVASYPHLTSLDVAATTFAARSEYNASRAIWEDDQDVDCKKQVFNSTMCSNCLAIQRRLACAKAFPRCIDGVTKGVCTGLCKDVNERCLSSLPCESAAYAEDNCSGAASLSLSLIAMLLVGLSLT